MDKDALITSQSHTIQQLSRHLEHQSIQLEKLTQQLDVLQHVSFGKKSEQQVKAGKSCSVQDALPLYRQMLRYRRSGDDVPDSILGNWVKASALLLEPMVNTMREVLPMAKKIHTDDAPVLVLAQRSNQI